MLPLALLLCSLVRALPSRCHAHDYENVLPAHDDPVDAAKVAPIGNALYAPEPEPTAQASTSGSAGSDSGVAPVTAPKTVSATRVSSSDDDDEGSRVRPSTGAAGDTDLSASANAPAPPSGDCKCGYILSAHSNAYFPSAHIVNFASLPQGPLQISDLNALGFEVNNQWQVGGAYQGTRSVGSIKALSGLDGALALTVKGGQRMGGDIEAAEVIFQPEGGMTGGVFSMEAMLDATPGTCQSIFTYNLLQGAPGDEQDIEILGQTIFGTMENGTPPGVQLTNHDPAGTKLNSHKTVPFVADPTIGYSNYTIAWLPGQTSYYMNGQALESPEGHFSVNPNNLFINHWSNGDPGFTQGPPTKDVVMKVKSVTFYYAQTGREGVPAGCSKEAACVV